MEQVKYLNLAKEKQEEEELTLQKEAEVLYKQRVQKALDKSDWNKTNNAILKLSQF